MSVWVLRDCYFKRQYLYGFEGELTHLKLPIVGVRLELCLQVGVFEYP